jgi:hypothetical protein
MPVHRVPLITSKRHSALAFSKLRYYSAKPFVEAPGRNRLRLARFSAASQNSSKEIRMRKRMLSLAVFSILMFGLSYPAIAPAAPASPEPHPEIRAAINSLRHAKEHLEHAAHDFGGHRVEAIGAIDRALEQLEVCLKYDK